MEVEVLRIGHRAYRDIRVTTHCALVARALGAKRIVIAGEKDEGIAKTVKGVNERFGKGINVAWTEHATRHVKKRKKQGYKIVHLTMYGLPVEQEAPKIRHYRKVLVIVGAEKVPAEFYRLADHNIGVTNQPHSEIAALALFFHLVFDGNELQRKFPGAKIRIVPQACGKKIKEKKPRKNSGV